MDRERVEGRIFLGENDGWGGACFDIFFSFAYYCLSHLGLVPGPVPPTAIARLKPASTAIPVLECVPIAVNSPKRFFVHSRLALGILALVNAETQSEWHAVSSFQKAQLPLAGV